MPFVQYISSAGILHSHDTDVQTRTILLDDARLDELRRCKDQPAGAKREPLKLRALVVNQRTRTSSPKNMAPGAIIDLCDSDDDGASLRGSKSRLNIQPTSSGEKSDMQLAKDSNRADSKAMGLLERLGFSSDKTRRNLPDHQMSKTGTNGTNGTNGQQKSATAVLRDSSEPMRSAAKARGSLAQRGISPVRKLDSSERHLTAELSSSTSRSVKVSSKGSERASHGESAKASPSAVSAREAGRTVKSANSMPSATLKRKRDDPIDQLHELQKKRRLGSGNSDTSSVNGSVSKSSKKSAVAAATPPSIQRRTPPLSATDEHSIALTSDSPAKQTGGIISLVSDDETDGRPVNRKGKALRKSQQEWPSQPGSSEQGRLATPTARQKSRAAESSNARKAKDSSQGQTDRSTEPRHPSSDPVVSGRKGSQNVANAARRNLTPSSDGDRRSLAASKAAEVTKQQLKVSGGPLRTRSPRAGVSDRVQRKDSAKGARSSSKPASSPTREPEIAESPTTNTDDVLGARTNGHDEDSAVGGAQLNNSRSSTEKGVKSDRPHDDSGYASLESNDSADAVAKAIAGGKAANSVSSQKNRKDSKQIEATVEKSSGALSGQTGVRKSPVLSTGESSRVSGSRDEKLPALQIVSADARPAINGESAQSGSGVEARSSDPTDAVFESVEKSPSKTRVMGKAGLALRKAVIDNHAASSLVGGLKGLANGDVAGVTAKVTQGHGDERTAASDDVYQGKELGSSIQQVAKATPQTSGVLGTSLTNQIERILGRQLEELRSDNEYWTRAWMRRARAAAERSFGDETRDIGSTTEADQPFSFAAMRPLQVIRAGKVVQTASSALFATERLATPGVKASKKTLTVPVTTFDTIDTMPNYAHYVSIRNNFLAPNLTTMHCWPYFGDDFEMEKAEGLKEQYKLDIVERYRKLLRLLQAEKYDAYIETALKELQITWADVLRFLLEAEPDVGTDPDAQKALKIRRDYCAEDFTRKSGRAAVVLSSLPASSQEKLASAAMLCENFQRMVTFSLWHVARRHQFEYVPKQDNDAEGSMMDALTCRICLRFDCPYHGELNEQEDEYSEAGSDATADSPIVTDIIHPQEVNHRIRVAFPPIQDLAIRESVGKSDESGARLPQHSVQHWQTNYVHRPDERGPFYPCHHPGISCSEAGCSCFENKLPCEKTCSCPKECSRKFRGCGCAPKVHQKGQRFTCFEDDRCVCYQLGRECDPDLCGACGVCDVLDPVNRHDDSILLGRCRNASIQRGVTKHTLLGDSGIHGLGLYAGESIAPYEFVGEYKGEIITKEEAERRGAVYEHQKLSYLFSLNASQEIDSTYFGNKVRFINHASQGKSNLYPRIVMVNTVHRIALYGDRAIKKGEELLFDYGPKFPDEQLGGKKSRKSAPHVRNANLVRDEFWDVEEAEDELGNRRARKVTRGRGRPRKSDLTDKAAPKQRGGKRPGAGRKRKSLLGIGQGESESEEDREEDVEVETRPSAADRLAAYNISDDSREDAMEVDVATGADDGEFEPEESESEESVASDEDD